VDNLKPQLGMEFESPAQYRQFIRNYGCMKGYDLEWPKNKGGIIITCKTKGCPLRAYGSWNTDKSKFVLKSQKLVYNCGRVLENKQVTSHWIVKKYLELFRDDPTVKVKVLRAMIKRDISAED